MSTKLMRASIVLMFEQAFGKLIGLVSTLILTRILMPEDFGLVAISLLIIGFFEVLSITGTNDYLLTIKSIDDKKINTAWSINLTLKSILFCFMVVIAYPAGLFYDDYRVSLIIWASSCIFLLGAFENPGIIYLKRAQKYEGLLKFSLLSKVISVIITIVAAIYFQNFWALIVGKLSSSVSSLYLTNKLYPFKREFCFDNAKEQWRFSGWIIPQSIFGYLRAHFDSFFISKFYGMHDFGSFSTIKYLSFIPSEFIISPLLKPFTHSLSENYHQGNNFHLNSNIVLILSLFMSIPISIIMIVAYSELCSILLGANWSSYSLLFSFFAILIPSFVLQQHASRTLIILKKPKIIFFYQLFSMIFIYGFSFYLGQEDIFLFCKIKITFELVCTVIFLLSVEAYFLGSKNFTRVFIICLTFFIFSYITIFVCNYFDFNHDISLFSLVLKSTIVLLIWFILLGIACLFFSSCYEVNFIISKINAAIKSKLL